MGLIAVGLALLSCSSSSATGSAAGSGNSAVCLPGHEVACGCTDGRESARSCKADGSGYLACICGTSGARSSGESGAAGEAGATSSAGAAGDAAGTSAQ
ncbi:MAG TPA: hypothetical protein VGF76_15905 [Polyangiaceae bacterium]